MTNRTRYIELCALVAGSLVIWRQPIAANLKLALSSDAHTHILLILPLSLALVYLEGKEARLTFESRVRVGGILLAAALLLRAVTAWNAWHLSPNDLLSLSMFALVIWWIGSVILCFGLQTFRSLLFPLCFLFLIVPFPGHVLNWITGFLQNQSAVAASILFRCARVPVTRDGIMLSIPGLDIAVAHECSSIRSSMMLIITTMFLAHLFLRSRWKQALLIVIAIPLSVAKNALRIFTIAELGTRVDPGFLDGRLHRQGGIVFFGLAVAVVVVLLWGLTRSESRTPVAVGQEAEGRAWQHRGK
ncbi:MAG: exosortase/archaeosortase family protein [Terriglobales bacterium]